MCFGNQSQGTTTTNNTPDPRLTQAALDNLGTVKDLQAKGFEGFGGQQVANIDPMQQATIGNAFNIANDGTGAKATGLIDQYAGAPAQSVKAGTIADNMSPYMSQYVMQALGPQLQQLDNSNAKENAAVNATATGSGAFGDARAGIEASNTRFNQDVTRSGVIGNAYNQAFNTAIGAGAQDVANKLSADNANAGYAETALQRALGGSTALQGLQTGQIANQGTANGLAGQNTAQQQAQLTAAYNQWLMKQQYPFQTATLANQTLAAGSGAMPSSSTSEKSAPDNSGLAIGGALLSAFI